MDSREVMPYVHDTNVSTFMTWFDDNGLVIFEVVQCFLYL